MLIPAAIIALIIFMVGAVVYIDSNAVARGEAQRLHVAAETQRESADRVRELHESALHDLGDAREEARGERARLEGHLAIAVKDLMDRQQDHDAALAELASVRKELDAAKAGTGEDAGALAARLEAALDAIEDYENNSYCRSGCRIKWEE